MAAITSRKSVHGLERHAPATPLTTSRSRMRTESSISDKGSFIKVVARVRPMLAVERDNDAEDTVMVGADGQTLVVTDKRERKQFAVDQVFDSRAPTGNQANVFNSFGRDLVNQSLKGYNVCIFAYGHTGSGKTYTMLGDVSYGLDMGTEDTSHAGLLPRFLHGIFLSHAQDAADGKAHYICEFYEVYNETIKDLLAPGTKGVDRTRKVHVHPKHGVRIENLTFNVVGSAEEALGLVQFGTQMRTVATTTLNERSSRSHAIFTLKFELQDPYCASTVTFVDLAGREDQTASKNQAAQFRETCFINTSLFHLAHVITKLSEGHLDRGSLSDFRNSKLTLLLSQALTGSSKTALIATLAPLQRYFEDTVSTLHFAQSVKKIQTRPTVNKNSNALLADLEAEVRALQKELGESKTSEVEKEQELLAAQIHINYYKKKWEEVVFKSEEIKAARRLAVERLGLSDMTTPGLLPTLTAHGHFVPFFTKLCDDPSLQGYCNFFLKERSLRIGSHERSCDIVLQGLGMTPQMCEVRLMDEGDMVQVELVSAVAGSKVSNPRVLVNGQALRYGERSCAAMGHGDCIVLGYSHAFRLVVPTKEAILEAGCADPRVLARVSLQSLDVSSVFADTVEEADGAVKELLPFIRQIGERKSERVVQTFIRAVKAMKPLIDEANLITTEILGNSPRFELHALTDFYHYESDKPELVVCVVQDEESGVTKLSSMGRAVLNQQSARGVDQSRLSILGMPSVDPPLLGRRIASSSCMDIEEHMTAGGKPLLYVWSVEKFLGRLHAIRDVYQEGCENKDNFASVRSRLASQPFLNPWREATLDDVRLLAESAIQSPFLPILKWQLPAPSRVASEGLSPDSSSPTMPWLLPRGTESEIGTPRTAVSIPNPLDRSFALSEFDRGTRSETFGFLRDPNHGDRPVPCSSSPIPVLQLPVHADMVDTWGSQQLGQEEMCCRPPAVPGAHHGQTPLEEVHKAAVAVAQALGRAKPPPQRQDPPLAAQGCPDQSLGSSTEVLGPVSGHRGVVATKWSSLPLPLGTGAVEEQQSCTGSPASVPCAPSPVASPIPFPAATPPPVPTAGAAQELTGLDISEVKQLPQPARQWSAAGAAPSNHIPSPHTPPHSRSAAAESIASSTEDAAASSLEETPMEPQGELTFPETARRSEAEGQPPQLQGVVAEDSAVKKPESELRRLVTPNSVNPRQVEDLQREIYTRDREIKQMAEERDRLVSLMNGLVTNLHPPVPTAAPVFAWASSPQPPLISAVAPPPPAAAVFAAPPPKWHHPAFCAPILPLQASMRHTLPGRSVSRCSSPNPSSGFLTARPVQQAPCGGACLPSGVISPRSQAILRSGSGSRSPGNRGMPPVPIPMAGMWPSIDSQRGSSPRGRSLSPPAWTRIRQS